MADRNDMAVWFPPLVAAGVPVPRTELVHADVNLLALLDGREPVGWRGFYDELLEAAERIAPVTDPVFLRTGHGSGKHEWDRCCYVADRERLSSHVVALVEWSECAAMPYGLPTSTWAVRELLETSVLFRCRAFGGFPVTREFRVFIRGDTVEHIQPYWPPAAVLQGGPDSPIWRERLRWISQLADGEAEELAYLAGMASGAQDGEHYWSVDLLQDRDRKWWVCDMASGEDSFRYDP